MRGPAGAVLVAALLVIAGCNAPTARSSGDAPTAGSLAGSNAPPPTADRLGWENGYWYNASLSVTTDDGLNESEREAVVSRAMARVERIRRLEFRRFVPVNLTTRAAYRNRTTGGSGGGNGDARTFDNVKSEALFLVGERSDSVSKTKETRSQTVLGYYSSGTKAIVLVSESETPQLNSERTLAHELVHALQDQHFGLGFNATTEDARNGRLGLVEGDAMVVQHAYMDRCGRTWECVGSGSGGGGSDESGGDSGENASASRPSHMGLYLASIFPYTDGATFVQSLRRQGGWTAVNGAYDDVPVSAAQIIDPDRYPGTRPADVRIRDDVSGGWERVRPPGPNAGRLGQALASTMFMYTLYDEYNRSAVVSPREVLNVDADGNVNDTDPLNYDLAYTDGWRGDRLHAYQRGNETAYVWKTVWESRRDAREFAVGYRRLLAHWGGERVGEHRWRLAEDSPFSDVVELRVEGRTVTVVNAPTTDDLSHVAPADGADAAAVVPSVTDATTVPVTTGGGG